MEIYTDGGCLGNPGPGGLGVVFADKGKIIEEYQQGYCHTTNNRMEYRAVLYALEQIKARGLRGTTIYSDSKYVIESLNNWGHKWKALGWQRNKSGSEKIQNLDLFKTCYLLNQALDVQWQWVKGHAGHRLNERADQLANSAAAWPKNQQLEDVEIAAPHDTEQKSLF